MPDHEIHLDRVFNALADPTRRAVLASLTRGPATVSKLARPFDMTLPSFTQHLKVLERSGLVRSTKNGRSRIVCLVPDKMSEAGHWLERQRSEWEQRFNRMQEYVLNLEEPPNDT